MEGVYLAKSEERTGVRERRGGRQENSVNHYNKITRCPGAFENNLSWTEVVYDQWLSLKGKQVPQGDNIISLGVI